MVFEKFKPNTIFMSKISDNIGLTKQVIESLVGLYQLKEPVYVEYWPSDYPGSVAIIDSAGELHKLVFPVNSNEEPSV